MHTHVDGDFCRARPAFICFQSFSSPPAPHIVLSIALFPLLLPQVRTGVHTKIQSSFAVRECKMEAVRSAGQ